MPKEDWIRMGRSGLRSLAYASIDLLVGMLFLTIAHSFTLYVMNFTTDGAMLAGLWAAMVAYRAGR